MVSEEEKAPPPASLPRAMEGLWAELTGDRAGGDGEKRTFLFCFLGAQGSSEHMGLLA